MYGAADVSRPRLRVPTIAVSSSAGCAHLVPVKSVLGVLEAVDAQDASGVIAAVPAAVGRVADLEQLAALEMED